jgi:hypothetical protein
MIAEGDVKIKNGFKVSGIAPPDLASYDATTRKLYWTWVLKLALARKDKELAAGLDKDGKPLRPIRPATRKHRRSAMTPSGKGDPAAPPLMPAFQKSRTRSLLNGRALSTHVDMFWRFDSWTGESWAVVLSYQAARGRDVFGLSKEGLAWIKVKSWAMWADWKAGTLRQIADKPAQRLGVPRIGRYTAEHVDYGVSTAGNTGKPANFKPGTHTGFSTPAERAAYFRQTAGASLPGRAANPGSKSPIVGPKYNRLLAHVWGKAGGAARGGSPPRGPRISPPKPPTTPKPVVPVNRLPKVAPPKPPAPPPPVLKPLPPPPPGPSGPAVSNALANQAKGKTAEAIRGAIAAIDRIHGDGVLPKIPVKQSASTRNNGVFWSYGRNRPNKIDISSKGDHPGLTTAHEIGHFLDNSAIPCQEFGARMFGRGVTKEWLEAIEASKAVEQLKALKLLREIKSTHANGATVTEHVDQKYVSYLLKPNELWARSYAQYVAVKSGDKTLLSELDADRGQKSPYNIRQWSDDDFKPILKAIDAMFTALGWIK